MDLGLAGKVVLVTGAGSGIGQSIALAFAEEGARVIVNDRTHEHCVDTLELLERCGSEGTAAPFDVSRPDDVMQTVAMLEGRLGCVDILVNNAAVMLGNLPFIEKDPLDAEREIMVSLFGTLHCSRAVLAGMIARQYGTIINIVSDAGRVGQENEVAYSTAKGGVMSFTKSLAREVGRHGVNVNAVSPAATNTALRKEMLARLAEKIGEGGVSEREEKVRRAYPVRRIGEPEDTASAVLFLAGGLARHITGQILSVNGGYAMPG